MQKNNKFREALDYHQKGRPGKTQIQATKPTATQNDLSLAYSPGVAGPCIEIAKNPDDVFKYTNRSNLVAVITNGTAVLGLGNIGPAASKPVMEGKAVLFKRFADIDVFDLELDTEDPQEIIRACQLLEPTFGGINLEDIKAPDSFIIEDTLRETMGIPVFHDDQHGTAIIAGAGLLNACELTGRDIATTTVVVNGAGAAGIATAKFVLELGISPENLLMCDSRGVIHDEREGLNEYKQQFAVKTEARSLADAMKGLDVFIGVSVKDAVTQDMVKSMADDCIVFALANPDPEIPYEKVKEVRPDAIVATGRTDYPNQVNNVLGFPYIFRGALDVHATTVTESMKVAAAKAIAALAREPVPDSVLSAYEVNTIEYGKDYIIPKPFDPRVLGIVAPAVAAAATEAGVARCPLDSVQAYQEELQARFESRYGVMRSITVRAKKEPQSIVFPQGADLRILRAARRLVDENIARPIILGRQPKFEAALAELGIDGAGIDCIDPRTRDARRESYGEAYFAERGRRGITASDAQADLSNPYIYAAVMLQQGDADALIGGLTTYYPKTLKPVLEMVPMEEGRTTVSAVYILLINGQPYFLADCAVNPEPTAEQLAEIALSAAKVAHDFDVTPGVAMISYSNFGSARGEEVVRLRKAIELCQAQEPDLVIDGEMQADTAVDGALLRRRHPFSTLNGAANVLVFPNLTAANAAYKLLHRLGGAEVIGPILTGPSKAVHVAQRDAEVGDIVNLAAIAVIDAQRK
ncbi:MAG: NADP-dependent malic enzyme [Myxococcales bacterium]|nr:NADP-dependent malic enzyme [Myxococcales bacterium]